MCIKRYKTIKGKASVTLVIFERETDNFLIKGDIRTAKRGQWNNYYLTFMEAKEAIVSIARANVRGCQERLNVAGNFLHKTQAMKADSVDDVKIRPPL